MMMSQRRNWRFQDGVLLVGLTGLAILATFEVFRDIYLIGMRDAENSYVLLAVPVALWLFWIRRDRLRYVAPTWTPVGPLVVGLGWLTAWVGFEHGHDVLRHFGALLIVGGAAVTILGLRFVRQFLPAILALLFVLPVPGQIRQEIALPLQEWTATATHFLLETFNFRLIQDGLVLRINGQDVAVAEACNGMRMVSSLGLVTFAFVFSVPMRTSLRLVFLLMSPLIALVVNIARLVPSVILYGYSEPAVADAFHDWSGWAMLLLALVILWGMVGLLRWLEIPVAPYSAPRA